MAKESAHMSETTVLVVEDDEDMRTVFSAALGHVGYHVITAATGIDGMRIARDTHPDVILLDLSLPGATGWEVVRRLKASTSTSDIPVLLVTGYTNVGWRARAEGCAACLTKPVRLDALRTTIASLVPQSHQLPAT
jgi:CheY-like chemotaxis protein